MTAHWGFDSRITWRRWRWALRDPRKYILHALYWTGLPWGRKGTLRGWWSMQTFPVRRWAYRKLVHR